MMTEVYDSKSVAGVTASMIASIKNNAPALSGLRRSIGKPLSMTEPAVMMALYSGFPQWMVTESDDAIAARAAVYKTLQLYALCKQGSFPVSAVSSHKSIGTSLRGARTDALDRRFSAMLTSCSFEELTQHLRHLIAIAKNASRKQTNMKIDFPCLAQDLYWYQKEGRSAITQWAVDYFSYKAE